MRLLPAIAIAVGAFALGGAAVQSLHAQIKPPTYAIAVIDIRDAEAYKAAAPAVRDRIMKMGAKPLVAAGVAGSSEVLVPEGEKAPSRLVIWEWPNLETYNKWWAEVGTKDVKMLSQHATLKLYAAEGMSK